MKSLIMAASLLMAASQAGALEIGVGENAFRCENAKFGFFDIRFFFDDKAEPDSQNSYGWDKIYRTKPEYFRFTVTVDGTPKELQFDSVGLRIYQVDGSADAEVSIDTKIDLASQGYDPGMIMLGRDGEGVLRAFAPSLKMKNGPNPDDWVFAHILFMCRKLPSAAIKP